MAEEDVAYIFIQVIQCRGGKYQSRGYGIAADIFLSHLGGDIFSQIDDTCFAGSVESAIGVGCQSAYRCYVYDISASVSGHDGNDLLRKIHRAAKVQMEYFVEVIDIQLFNIQITFGVGSAYVVYKYVYLTVFLHGEINQFFTALEFGSGEIDGTHVGPCLSEFGGKLVGPFLRMIGDDYFSSFGDDAACGCFANATGSTGDDDYFVFKSFHIC